jgi:hypothetical protein
MRKKVDSPVCKFSKMLEILRRKSMGCGADIQFKHPSSGVDVRERNVDTFLESVYLEEGG